MGERKGTNLYYPPDYDPKKGGLNKFRGTHALRERARKLHMGILIIRFEMPYNIWCNGCGKHIGMGVRYNAEKKKVGMYYSTPVYQFRMKCHLCDNHFEIKTDPANLDYVIVSGARRQENRWDPTVNEQVVPEDKATSRRLFDDAMFKLEHGEGDKGKAKDVAPALSRLVNLRDELWHDDYAANSLLRANFRTKRKELKAREIIDASLKKKSSLEIALEPENKDDVKLASLLALTPAQSPSERQSQVIESIITSSVLPSCSKISQSALDFRASKHLNETLSRSKLGITICSGNKDKEGKQDADNCKQDDDNCKQDDDNCKQECENNSEIINDENKSEILVNKKTFETTNSEIKHNRETEVKLESSICSTSLVSGDYNFSSSDSES